MYQTDKIGLTVSGKVRGSSFHSKDGQRNADTQGPRPRAGGASRHRIERDTTFTCLISYIGPVAPRTTGA